MATFRKRGLRWHAQVRRAGHEQVTKSFQSKAEAQAWARQIETEIDQRRRIPASKSQPTTTLGSLIERYKSEVTPRKKSAPKEIYRLDCILSHPIAATLVHELTPGMLAAYREERLRQVQSQAVRHDMNVIAHVLKTAIREWDVTLPMNPMDLVAKPAPSRARQRRLEPAELDQLINTAEKLRLHRLVPLIQLAIETGMRRAELLSLQWANIDLKKRTAHIPMTKNGYPRTIPLTQRAVLILLQLKRPHTQVFSLTVPWIRFAWDKVIRDAGINNLHFHDLRHEAISRFFEKGLSIPEVALISGHKDIRMLYRYTHLRAVDVAKKLE